METRRHQWFRGVKGGRPTALFCGGLYKKSCDRKIGIRKGSTALFYGVLAVVTFEALRQRYHC